MDVVKALCDRRYTERTIGYCESHDQAMVRVCWVLLGVVCCVLCGCWLVLLVVGEG